MDIAVLLQEGARLHGQGALADAAGQYQRVLEAEPDHAQALYHLAVIACQQGRLDDGIALVRRSLARVSQQPRAHNLLGMALGRLGRSDEALASFDQALTLDPAFADAHGNRANALLEGGRVLEAVTALERAVALAPASMGDWLNLGTARQRLGRHEEALAAYDHALGLHPGFAPAHCNRGNVLAGLGRYEEALTAYDRALTLDRTYADALAGRAHVLMRLGRVEGALANLADLLAIAPDRTGVAEEAAQVLLAQGDNVRALHLIVRVLGLRDSPVARAVFVGCVANRKLAADPGGVRALMVRALSDPWDRPADLVVPALSLVKLSPPMKDACAMAVRLWPRRLTFEDLSGRFTAIADDALLRVVLETVPVCDNELERALTGIRAIFLAAAAEGPVTPTEDGLLRFFCALARQCYINEYVLDLADEEAAAAQRLRERLTRAIAAGEAVPVLWLVAAAMLFPLHTLPGAEALLGRSWSPAVAALLAQQVGEPLEERRLAASIEEMTPIADAVSLAVKQQYEENPYPRWVRPAPAPPARTMAEYFGDWLPAQAERERVDILVAGCGTGQNLVETARQFKNAQVLAIDLSRASLGYAKRQALALGLGNITFAVADILALDLGSSRFDIVDASGVLHHMADPWLGWRKLLALVRPGGFMRVGLYSRLARADVNAARALVAERSDPPSAEGIRRSRQEILALPVGAAARTVVSYLDFYATSECRDMLFHVQEHQMTLLEIGRFLDEVDATFLGFALDPGTLRAFQARFPAAGSASDLARWHELETERPATFAGMYQLWLRKEG
ncbi:MAG: tetratricopeptide repeat protein [Hyphomicrobiales bacterium]|nr:tetratricopeptide repeat protein [Hyphomicrobiales bacterium]